MTPQLHSLLRTLPKTDPDASPASPPRWLLTISTAVSMLAVAAGIVIATMQWASEAKARQAEVEMRAAKEFLTTMEFAHGRSSYVWSEKCVEGTLQRLQIQGNLARLADEYNRVIEVACSMRLPVGRASQKAEIQMLAEFGIRYPFLRAAAHQGLEALVPEKIEPDITKAALNRLDSAR